jgi:hypothetical protein
VEHTTSRLLVTTKRIRALIRKSNNCKLMLCLLVVIVVLIAVLLLVLRVAPLAAAG